LTKVVNDRTTSSKAFKKYKYQHTSLSSDEKKVTAFLQHWLPI